MTAPNRNLLWARAIVEECAAAGVERVVIAPGSRSTPLVVAADEHEAIETLVHPDERAASYLAVGRGRAIGRPTAVVTTSGTAVANCHPAVMEADEGRVPLIVISADRPPELLDSGANQTTDQQGIFAGAVRAARTLPEPAPAARRLRSLRVTVGRAVDAATGPPAGPVHLNVPLAKPLEPTPVDGDLDGVADRAPIGVSGRSGPAVDVARGEVTPPARSVERTARALAAADRPALIVGPRGPPVPDADALAALAAASEAPVFADPLSGLRFGPVPSVGAYDGLYAALDAPAPDVAVRFGASPTSKPLRQRLAAADPDQVLVDPAVEYREATFHAERIVGAEPSAFARQVAARIDDPGSTWRSTLADHASSYWATIERACADAWTEGALVRSIVEGVPSGTAILAGNSMPVRDLDRFARPTDRALAVHGNRGVSGIDGLTSTALGIADADGPVVAIVGDQSALHDMGGLIAADRVAGDVTIAILNNDGGGIFEELPISSFEGVFEEYFRAPHGLTFAGAAEQYELGYRRVADRATLDRALADSVAVGGVDVLEVDLRDADSHDWRARVTDRVADSISWPADQ